jgi:diguanylate cyclase (GGDEF)-like protein
VKKDDIKESISAFDVQDIIIDLLSSLSALKELSELSCQASHEKELVSQALSVLIQNQDMERCSFFILNNEHKLVNLAGLSCQDSSGGESLTPSPLEFQIGEGIIGQAAQTGELQYCENCQQDIRFSNPARQAADNLPGSVISVPVFALGELLGVLNISHPDAYYFSEWHIRLLHIYRNMMGELISNYRLLRQMENQITLRTQKLETALEDINRLKDYYENISMLDELTGLFNRRYFYAQVGTILANAKRYGQSFCILVLDLDNFKAINDNYGHAFGDIVLKDVAVVLREEVRESDIVARFGGEEFIIIFTNAYNDKGRFFAERIRKKIQTLTWLNEEQTITITISIGVYCQGSETLSANHPDIDALIQNADKALYLAKAQGRNQVKLFEDVTDG